MAAKTLKVIVEVEVEETKMEAAKKDIAKWIEIGSFFWKLSYSSKPAIVFEREGASEEDETQS